MKKQLFLIIILIFGGMILPTFAQTDDSNAPTLTAEEISKRIIELIKAVKNRKDVSPENIERLMKIKVEFDEKSRQSYGFGGRIEGTSQWAYNLSVYPYPGNNKTEADTLNFSFSPLADDEKVRRDDYAPVCAVDFDSYSKELKNAGFSSAPYYGEHGRLLWWNFSRGAVSVQITAYGESEKRADHQCVNTLTLAIHGLAEPIIEETGDRRRE